MSDDKTKRLNPTQMNRTWLIQRLEKPMRDGGVTTPFTFGGGYIDGGLSKDAISALRGVWSFDYMGAAEYEWGAVPSALSRIARDRKSFVAGSVTLKPSAIKKSYDKRVKHPIDPQTVFYLAHKDEATTVEERIQQFAKNEGEAKIRDYCGLDGALRGEQYARAGWLELDNGFLFFTDRTMFERAASMFEVATK